MLRTLSTHPRRLIALAVAVGAISLSACGSSRKPTAATGAGEDFVAFSRCMRTHGVSGFPDPGPGGGINIPSSSGINPSSPAFQAAQSACSKLLPGGGPAAHAPASAQARELMLGVSRCMRADGVTGFPDPTVNPPSDPGAFSVVLGRGGVFIAVPSTIDTESPAYRQSAAACRFGIPRTARTAPAG